MSKKHDSNLKILQKLSDISEVRSPKTHEYHFIYSPKRLSGPYEGCNFQLKLILPQGFPENSPQLFFLDPPYHLNIKQTDGRFNAGFLNQDWCSFMTFDMIFDEINALLEKPDQKYAVCEQMKKIYLKNQNFYLDQIKAWRQSHGFSLSNKPCPLVDKQKSIKKSKQSQIQSIISFPETTNQFEANSINRTQEKLDVKKNKVRLIHSNSQDVQFFSPPLRRKTSSPLVVQSSGKLKNAQVSSFNTSSSNKNYSSPFSPEISRQNLNAEQQQPQKIKQIKSSQKIIKPTHSPIMKLKDDQDSRKRQNQKLLSNKNERIVKQTSQNLEVTDTQNQKMRVQKKKTMEIRNLFKEKSRSRQDKNDEGQFSVQSIQQKFQEQIHSQLQRQKKVSNNQPIPDFQINIRDKPRQFRVKHNTDQLKTTRRFGYSPNPNLSPSENEQKEILQTSIKTIRLAQKLNICDLDDHSIKIHLEKVVTLIKALMNECNYIEKVVELSYSETFKQILQTKMQQQAQFIEKLQNLAGILKKSIVEHLTAQVQEILLQQASK